MKREKKLFWMWSGVCCQSVCGLSWGGGTSFKWNTRQVSGKKHPLPSQHFYHPLTPFLPPLFLSPHQPSEILSLFQSTHFLLWFFLFYYSKMDNKYLWEECKGPISLKLDSVDLSLCSMRSLDSKTVVKSHFLFKHNDCFAKYMLEET